MHAGAWHGMAWVLSAIAAACTLSGCIGQPFQMELANEGVYPITEVRVYPEPGPCGGSGPQADINRLPRDDSGATMVLAPRGDVVLPWVFRPDVYMIAVTFYDTQRHVLRQVIAPDSYDLTFVKGAYPVVVRAGMDEANIPNIEVEFTTRF